MPTVEQQKRLEDVNQLIQLIASLDRRFFYSKSKDQVAFFEYSKSGSLYFVDDYSGKRINPYGKRGQRDQGFSHGGTLWIIVTWLHDFIAKGEQVSNLMDFKETWAYSFESTMKIREKAMEIRLLSSVNYPYERWM